MHPTLEKYTDNPHFIEAAITKFKENLEQVKGNKTKLLSLQERVISLREIYPENIFQEFNKSITDALRGL